MRICELNREADGRWALIVHDCLRPVALEYVGTLQAMLNTFAVHISINQDCLTQLLVNAQKPAYPLELEKEML